MSEGMFRAPDPLTAIPYTDSLTTHAVYSIGCAHSLAMECPLMLCSSCASWTRAQVPQKVTYMRSEQLLPYKYIQMAKLQSPCIMLWCRRAYTNVKWASNAQELELFLYCNCTSLRPLDRDCALCVLYSLCSNILWWNVRTIPGIF